MKKYNWEVLKQEFIFSEFISLKDFLVAKNIIEKDKRIPGGIAKKTKGWLEEKQKFWQEKLENFELDPKQQQKLAYAVYEGVDVFADMLIYYARKQREKIREGKKGIYIDELSKFGKLLEYYHKLKLGSENQTIDLNVKSEISLKDLLNEIR